MEERFGRKWPKTTQNHIMSPQAMYFRPKTEKTVKTRIFSDTTLAFDDSNQLSPVSDQVLDKSDVRIRRKCPKKPYFSAKMAKFWTKKGPKMARFFCRNINFY